jgi:hypothetical protein
VAVNSSNSRRLVVVSMVAVVVVAAQSFSLWWVFFLGVSFSWCVWCAADPSPSLLPLIQPAILGPVFLTPAVSLHFSLRAAFPLPLLLPNLVYCPNPLPHRPRPYIFALTYKFYYRCCCFFSPKYCLLPLTTTNLNSHYSISRSLR